MERNGMAVWQLTMVCKEAVHGRFPHILTVLWDDTLSTYGNGQRALFLLSGRTTRGGWRDPALRGLLFVLDFMLLS